MNIQEILNAPVPLKKAILFSASAIVGCTVSAAFQMRSMANQANAIIADQSQLNEMYNESVHFLMQRADPATLHEFNSQLEFWRVIREMAPAGTETEEEA